MSAPRMSLGAARRIAGTLGFPSKMPGSSYGLPVSACKTGAKLAQIAGSACSQCYAAKDAYTWTNSQKAQHKRLGALAHPQWVPAMTRLLLHAHAVRFRKIDLGMFGIRRGQRHRLNEMGHHRWHDSGDLQSIDHLDALCEVVRDTPKIRHWLPTTELGMVRRFAMVGGQIPGNLTIRVSGVMIDDDHRRAWPTTSSVSTTASPSPGAYVCPAPKQGHRCLACRACWSRDVAHIVYARH